MARIIDKDPDVDVAITIDWSNQLGVGATITGSVWTLPSGVTETTSSSTATTASITVGGGTDGTTYGVTDDITRSIGGPLDATVYVYVKQNILAEVRGFPLTLSEVKHSLRVTTDDDDAYITDLMSAALEYVEASTGRDMMSKTRTINVCRFASKFEIEQVPMRAVARIRYYDTDNAIQTLAVDQYSVYERPDGTQVVEPAIDASWPATAMRGDAVELLLVSGYGTDPAAVPAVAKQVIRMIIRHWYDNAAGAVTGTIFTKTTPAIDAMLWNLKTGFYANV